MTTVQLTSSTRAPAPVSAPAATASWGHGPSSQAFPEPLPASCFLPSYYATRISTCASDQSYLYHSQANYKCYLLKPLECEMSCKLIGF